MSNDFHLWMEQRQQQLEQALLQRLPAASHHPADLHAAMRHSTLDGGKRIRPLLVWAAGEISGGDSELVLSAACAVELIHSYSLIHDDLPSMDNDVLRRGKPTCHVAYGEATALLAGDSLQSLAFELLAQPCLPLQAKQQLNMLHILARASGSLGMAGGQAIDLASVGIPLNVAELELMHTLKTGALINASVLLGALCGQPLPPNQLAALKHYAHCVGLAFQVVDDVLDATTTSDMLGKTAGKDADHDKPTYVTLMGISAARTFAADLHQQAILSLQTLPNSQRLGELAHLILQRTY